MTKQNTATRRAEGRSAEPRSASLLGRESLIVILCGLVGAGVGAYRLWTVRPSYVAQARLYVEPVADLSKQVWDNQPAEGEQHWSPPTDLLLGTEIANLAVKIGSLDGLPIFAGESDVPLSIISNLHVEASPAKSGFGQIQDLSYAAPAADAAERVLESVIAAYKISADKWQTRNQQEMLDTLTRQRASLFERLQRKQLEFEDLKKAHPEAFENAQHSALADSRLRALVDARIQSELRRIDGEVRLATMQAMAPKAGADKDSAGGASDSLLYDSTVLDVLDPRNADHAAEGMVARSIANTPVASQSAEQDPATAVTQGNAAMSDVFDALGSGPATALHGFGAGAVDSGIDLYAEEQWVQRLAEVWGPDHPKLVAAKARLAELKRVAQQRVDRTMRVAETYVRMCAEEQQRLEGAINAHLASSSDDGGRDMAAVEAQILAQVIDRTEKVLASISQQTERLSLQMAAGGLPTVRISTMVPSHAEPVSMTKQRPKLLLVPVGIGLLVGFALAYLRNANSASPEVSRTGRSGFAEDGIQSLRRKRFVLGTVPALPRTSGRGSQRALGTWVLRDPQSKSAQTFRTLAKRVMRCLSSADARCVLFTSAREREGTSLVVANLATALAHSGRKVLVMDANYGHPSQHVLLSEVLGDDPDAAPEELTLAGLERGRAAVPTHLETLWLLPAWPRPAHPEDILRSTALREFLRQSTVRFDVILIDAPSVDAMTDGEAIADLADGVITVANAATGGDAALTAARLAARRFDLPSLGAIQNIIPPLGAPRASSTVVVTAGASRQTPHRADVSVSPALDDEYEEPPASPSTNTIFNVELGEPSGPSNETADDIESEMAEAAVGKDAASVDAATESDDDAAQDTSTGK